MTRSLGALLAVISIVAALGSGRPSCAAPSGKNLNSKLAAAVGAGLDDFYSRDFETARQEFEAALRIEPADSLALAFECATLLQLGPDRFGRFAARAASAAARNPRDAIAQTRAGYAYLFMADSDAKRGDDARDAFAKALAADTALAAAHVGMGIYRYQHGSESRSKAELLAALAIDPHDALAREYLSDIYQTQLDDPNRALAYLVDVPNVVPQYADAYYHLGSIMNDLGQYDAAIRYLRTAIDLDAGHVGEAGQAGLPLLGQIYLKIHRMDDAKRAFSEAVVFGEELQFSQAQLDKINHGQIK